MSTKIKICGLTRPEDIDFVNEARPDYIGFVFAKSRRQVSKETAKKLRERLHPSITPVGVFVNADVNEMASLANEGIISIIQLHGQETKKTCEILRKLTDAPLIKAIRADHGLSRKDYDYPLCSHLLFDNGSGGTGKTFSWDNIPDQEKPYFLAGGLSPENLAGIRSVHPAPFAVDLSSGVETDGKKDRLKIYQAVEIIRNLQ